MSTQTPDAFIPVNIWDDYYDDGYVPEGERQETCAYVESSEFGVAYCKAALERVLRHLEANTSLRADGVDLSLEYYDGAKVHPSLVGTEHERHLVKRWEIRFRGLTHARRERLVDELRRAWLDHEGAPYRIYSES